MNELTGKSMEETRRSRRSESDNKKKRMVMLPLTAALLAGSGFFVYKGVTAQPYEEASTPKTKFSVQANDPAPKIGGETSSKKSASSSNVNVESQVNPDDGSGSNTCKDRFEAYKGDDGTNLSKVSQQLIGSNREYTSSEKKIANSLGNCGNRLYIPQINSVSSVVPETLSQGKFLNIPLQSWRVGWYSQTKPLSSNTGNTMIAGHYALKEIPGALNRLSELKPGALIYTTDAKNKLSAWRVQKIDVYDKLQLPKEVYSPESGKRRLTLVTCGGKTGVVKVAEHGAYRGLLSNTIVFADQVPISG